MPKGAMGYLCSYMGKKEQTMPGNFTGHYFGSIARAKIPFGKADDHDVYKTHLDRMNTKLRKMGLCGFWKLEFQKRGAPHYHLLLIPFLCY